MKRILLAGCFLSASFTMAVAQQQAMQQAPATNAAASVQAIDPKTTFASKVNQFESDMARNNPEQARKTTGDLLAMMQTRMIAENKAMESAGNADKKAMYADIQKEQQLYTEIKLLSVDLNTNHAAMATKMRTFLQSY